VTDTRIEQQVRFLMELDKVKRITRQTPLADGSRLENDAEHSWHMAAWAMVMAEYAAQPVDLGKVLRLCLVHDVVEIDAGDAPAFDPAAQVGKKRRETRAADRIFGLLPADQAREFRALWEEFEAGETPEARLAVAVDRLQSEANNFASEAVAWRKVGVRVSQLANRIEPIRAASPRLWEYASDLMHQAAANGWLAEG
jgi:putative hydrolases of HD superfamily